LGVQVTGPGTITVAPDGKTMKVDDEYRDNRLKGTFVLDRAKWPGPQETPGHIR
jgi:hypothetical protein